MPRELLKGANLISRLATDVKSAEFFFVKTTFLFNVLFLFCSKNANDDQLLGKMTLQARKKNLNWPQSLSVAERQTRADASPIPTVKCYLGFARN